MSLTWGTDYNVLEWAKKVGVNKIMYATTISDSSDENSQVIDETYPHKYKYSGHYAMYAITKSTGVDLVHHYYEEYGISANIFRLPTIYNYSSNIYYYPDGVKRIRPMWFFINKALAGENIELWGNPKNVKEMVYVYDCAQMICNAIERDVEWGFFNVGTGIPITLEDEIKTIIEIFSSANRKSRIVYRPDKESSNSILMKIDNAVNLLGYKPQYGCKELFMDLKMEMEIKRFKDLESI